MRVLVACEYSGRVRDAFAARGHDAISCDLLPTDQPGAHYQGDVFDIINDGFDLMIALKKTWRGFKPPKGKTKAPRQSKFSTALADNFKQCDPVNYQSYINIY